MTPLRFFIFGALVTFCNPSVTAQKIGIRAGMNSSTMFIKDHYHLYSGSYKLSPGLLAGVDLEFTTKRENFSIETAIQYARKGYQIDEVRDIFSRENYDYQEQMHLHYLEAPVHMKFSFPHNNWRFYLLAGGYFGVALSGHQKATAEFRKETYYEEREVPIGRDPERNFLRSLDYGLSAGCGVHLGRFNLGANAQYGLANISSYREDEVVIKNKGVSVYLGFRLTR